MSLLIKTLTFNSFDLSCSYFMSNMLPITRSVFFNLGSAEPRVSLHSSLGSARILKLTLF